MTEQPTDSGLQGASDAHDLLIPKLDNAGVVRIPKRAESKCDRWASHPLHRAEGRTQLGNLSDLRNCHTIDRYVPL
jgi:hypothetical protein